MKDLNKQQDDEKMMTASNKIRDGMRFREMLFDPAVPDYAFLTRDEVIAAFDTSEPTLRRWALESGFPDPVAYQALLRTPSQLYASS